MTPNLLNVIAFLLAASMCVLTFTAAQNATNTTTSGNWTNTSTTTGNWTNTTTTWANTTTTWAANTTENVTTTWAANATTTTTMWVPAPNMTWGHIWVQASNPSSFDPEAFKLGLAADLNVNVNVFVNMTETSPGSWIVTIYAEWSWDIAVNATKLSPGQLSTLGAVIITLLETTTTGNWTMPPGNWTMPPGNWTQPPGNWTMPPGNWTEPNGSWTMPPNSTMPWSSTAAPNPPPANWNCDTLTTRVNCHLNSSCSDFNNTCRVRCDLASNNPTLCESWFRHCYVGADGKICKQRCDLIKEQNNCFASSDCAWYNGKCGLYCQFYNNDANACNMDQKCWYNANTMSTQKCLTRCQFGLDEISCEGLLSDDQCWWNKDSKTCLPACNLFNGDSAACQQNNCEYDPARGTCFAPCSWSNGNARECNKNSNCMYDSGKMMCLRTCTGYKIDSECAWNAACVWMNQQCIMNNCSAIKDAPTCEAQSSMCRWDFASGWCKPSCYAAMGQGQMCPPAPFCNASSGQCTPLPCEFMTQENQCVFDINCAWTGSACKRACYAAGDEMTCNTWAHCWFDRGLSMCSPRCGLLQTKLACEGGNIGGYGCVWNAGANKCYGSSCAILSRNASACAARAECSWFANSFTATCAPKCSLATNEQDCKGPFFQDAKGCIWDAAQSKCVVTCEYTLIANPAPSNCPAGICTMNANFSACIVTPPPPPPANMTSTTAGGSGSSNTTTSASTTSSANGNETTTTAGAAGNSTSTTSASTTSQGSGSTTSSSNGTTVSGQTTTTTTPTPTTTLPPGNPTVEFTINSGANATGNITAAAFKAALAAKLGIPAASLEVSISASGKVTVEFTGTNAATEFTAATNMDSTQLQSLGAASVSSTAPSTTMAPEEEEGANLGLIIGCAVGGVALIAIILLLVKKSSSGGTGSDYQDDKPMLEVPHQQGGRNAML